MREVTQESFAVAQGGSAVVVDVREPVEYVPGAVLMPMGQLPTRLSEIPKGLTPTPSHHTKT
jgi:rhodanese-related sulfurtransferase